jgi:hypothetical protein
MSKSTLALIKRFQDPHRDAKLAEAYRDLEGPIYDLERAAKIAERFSIDDPDEEELELGRFALKQFCTLASDLARLWHEKSAAA